MAELPLGNVPLSTIEDNDNIIFTEGQYAKKIAYSDVKVDMLGSANLVTKEPKTKESINEIVQDIIDTGGYGIISGGVVSAQTVPNMTVQVTACTLRTSTGARQIANANTSLAITTADTTNARNDIAYVDSTGVIQYMQGTAAATPIAPTTPTGGQLLAQINVAANATNITNANITDKRKTLISTDWLNAQMSELAKHPCCRVHNSATQSVASGVAILAFDTEDFDTDNIHNSTTNTRLVCQTAGKYQITGCGAFSYNGTGSYRGILIKLNNSSFVGESTGALVASSEATSISTTTMIDMVVNDYVELITYHNASGAISVTGKFMMVKVG